MIRAIELYPCAGGMAEGFRRAGITFDIAFDFSADACASYEANLGHRPICIDVRDVVRMARLGARFGRIDLLVADPPCTPWSRAGKRKGLDDEHDMLRETCELIGLLKPTCWLIGNVPGLDDSTNGDAVAATIGALSRRGYDVDYAKLNASSYGVPQHRVRPFWFGRPRGSEPLRWPTPTHGAPGNLALPGCELLPWVTCRDALQHLPLEELGRPVRVKWKRDTDHKTASPDEPAPTATKNTHGDGALLSVRVADTDGHPQPTPDSPSPTIRGGGRGHAAPDSILLVTSEERPRTRKRAFHNPHPPSEADAPARGLTTSPRAGHGGGAGVLLAHSNRGGHPLSEADAPAGTIVARADQRGARGGGVMLAASVDGGRNNHPPSTPNEPARTVTGSDGGGIKGHTLTWPWDVPATTVTQDDRLAPPGHHPESGSVLSVPNAVVLSEKARAILQGFPENWKFLGDTKRSRSAMIGMAMPPPMAHAVATSIVRWFEAFAQREQREAVGA